MSPAPAALRRADLLDGFTIPTDLEATRPPETRGIRRDRVRLMTTGPEGIGHHVFSDLPVLLTTGDLVVVNDSATLPAAVMVDRSLVIHFSTRLPGGLHVVEPRRPSGAASLPYEGIGPGRLSLPGGAVLELLAPYPHGAGEPHRLWVARTELPGPTTEYLTTWGRPIRYRHTDGPYKIEAYQTIFARKPGSAEMPSAGRPFTERLVTELTLSGVAIATLTLHTGVSSLEAGEDPYPEWFEIPEPTAALVNHTSSSGGRVIAVGTTVVRALETTADSRGVSHPGRSWTDLVIGPHHEPGVVDGLVTGWHEPESTHLDLLEAFAGRSALANSYRAALECGYLWHEFGDSHLILPG
ncbi:MAG TPA: S-adenosylmethionine:tRNA ribosyltransferase-isomerase [Acidimicrobiia bacterium]|nr:S-adenosylmethionine:tRNA ribosyltransferase-isomerase [Acidimicrobiia bacterium]